MKKKVILGIISLLCVGSTCLTSCMKDGVDGKDGINGVDGSAGKDGKDGVSVVSITKTSTSGLIDTYTILYSDGSTSLFTVTNGADGSQGIQGEKGVDGRSTTVTIGSNGNWYVDGVDTGISATGAKGDKGDKGADGKDGTCIYTGSGAPKSSEGKVGDLYVDSESGDLYSKGENGWIKTGNIKGSQGNDGTNGKDGVSIVGVSKTSTSDNVDVYTITYSDGSTSSFTVTNGVDGKPGA